jgi:hypothetical protein
MKQVSQRNGYWSQDSQNESKDFEVFFLFFTYDIGNKVSNHTDRMKVSIYYLTTDTFEINKKKANAVYERIKYIQ